MERTTSPIAGLEHVFEEGLLEMNLSWDIPPVGFAVAGWAPRHTEGMLGRGLCVSIAPFLGQRCTHRSPLAFTA